MNGGGKWITIEADTALYVDRGRDVILCDRLPRPVTLVLKVRCDSGRLPEGEDSRSEAECAASQSGGAEGDASPTLKSTPTRTAK